MDRLRWCGSLGWFLCLLACGGEVSERRPLPAADPATSTPARSPQPTGPAEPASRALPVGATFRHVVETAQQLEGQARGDSEAGCLLRHDPEGRWHLTADLAGAIRPLPTPPDELDGPLTATGAGDVALLTRWGPLGRPDATGPLLAAVTSLPPPDSESAIAVFATDQGVYLRRVGPGEPFDPEPQSADAVMEALRADPAPRFVTAEAAVEVHALEDLLRAAAQPSRAPVALAVVLPAGTRVPAAPPSGQAETQATPPLECPAGLPPLPATPTEPALDPRGSAQAVATLRDASARCLEAASGPAARGGRVLLALRIQPTGSVERACVKQSDLAAPKLHACLARQAQALRFPAPTPAGSVDAELPLQLAPAFPPAQRPLCAETDG